jgi:hypothetical protein
MMRESRVPPGYMGVSPSIRVGAMENA